MMTFHLSAVNALFLRRRAAVLGLTLFTAVIAGCATSASTSRLKGGLVVHTFRRDHANAHLVMRQQDGFLVDAGSMKNAAALESDIREAGFDPAKLRAIILTHAHADHAGGALHFKNKYGTRIVAGRDDLPMLKRGSNDQLCPTSKRARSRWKDDQSETFSATPADVSIEGIFDLGGLTGIPGRIIPLPGHTAGSIVVDLGEAALVGDTFRGAIIGSSAEVHFYMCDLEDNRRDIRSLLTELTPAATVFFTGHFGPVGRDRVLALTLPRGKQSAGPRGN